MLWNIFLFSKWKGGTEYFSLEHFPFSDWNIFFFLNGISSHYFIWSFSPFIIWNIPYFHRNFFLCISQYRFVIFHIIIYFRSVFKNFRLLFSLGSHFQFFVLMFVTFPNKSSKFVRQFEERLWKLYCQRSKLLRWSGKLFSKTQGFAEN